MKKQYNVNPRSGKCNPIEGIIIGGQSTNQLNTKNEENHTPEKMIGKLSKIIQNSSDHAAKEKATQAVELLAKFKKQNYPMKKQDRIKIFQQVNTITT